MFLVKEVVIQQTVQIVKDVIHVILVKDLVTVVINAM